MTASAVERKRKSRAKLRIEAAILKYLSLGGTVDSARFECLSTIDAAEKSGHCINRDLDRGHTLELPL